MLLFSDDNFGVNCYNVVFNISREKKYQQPCFIKDKNIKNYLKQTPVALKTMNKPVKVTLGKTLMAITIILSRVIRGGGQSGVMLINARDISGLSRALGSSVSRGESAVGNFRFFGANRCSCRDKGTDFRDQFRFDYREAFNKIKKKKTPRV